MDENMANLLEMYKEKLIILRDTINIIGVLEIDAIDILDIKKDIVELEELIAIERSK